VSRLTAVKDGKSQRQVFTFLAAPIRFIPGDVGSTDALSLSGTAPGSTLKSFNSALPMHSVIELSHRGDLSISIETVGLKRHRRLFAGDVRVYTNRCSRTPPSRNANQAHRTSQFRGTGWPLDAGGVLTFKDATFCLHSSHFRFLHFHCPHVPLPTVGAPSPLLILQPGGRLRVAYVALLKFSKVLPGTHINFMGDTY
jgi:hypothetical protein